MQHNRKSCPKNDQSRTGALQMRNWQNKLITKYAVPNSLLDRAAQLDNLMSQTNPSIYPWSFGRQVLLLYHSSTNNQSDLSQEANFRNHFQSNRHFLSHFRSTSGLTDTFGKHFQSVFSDDIGTQTFHQPKPKRLSDVPRDQTIQSNNTTQWTWYKECESLIDTHTHATIVIANHMKTLTEPNQTTCTVDSALLVHICSRVFWPN